MCCRKKRETGCFVVENLGEMGCFAMQRFLSLAAEGVVLYTKDLQHEDQTLYLPVYYAGLV